MKSSFAKSDKRHLKKKIAVHYSPHILNPKRVLSKKSVLSTFKALRVHVLLQKSTSALVVFEQKPINIYIYTYIYIY